MLFASARRRSSPKKKHLDNEGDIYIYINVVNYTDTNYIIDVKHMSSCYLRQSLILLRLVYFDTNTDR